MSDDKKAALGRILNVSIDRRRKVLSTILFKAIGMSLNEEKGEDAFDTTKMEKFLKALNMEVHSLNFLHVQYFSFLINLMYY